MTFVDLLGVNLDFHPLFGHCNGILYQKIALVKVALQRFDAPPMIHLFWAKEPKLDLVGFRP